jgi:hypothetical protein
MCGSVKYSRHAFQTCDGPFSTRTTHSLCATAPSVSDPALTGGAKGRLKRGAAFAPQPRP